ncbi:hypothetical protein SHDE107825_15260 [Shewanella denitrificans]
MPFYIQKVKYAERLKNRRNNIFCIVLTIFFHLSLDLKIKGIFVVWLYG